MQQWLKGLLGCAVAVLLAAPVVADDLVEEFGDPFGDYQGRWLYQNSNLNSYYHATGNCDINYRGNNTCGIWIADCQECGCGVGGNEANIIFKPEFGATITDISFDFSGYNATGLRVYDMDDNVLLDVVPVLTRNPCVGENYSASSGNGVSRIQIVSDGQVEGNTAMDNFKVTTGAVGCGYTIKKSKSKGGCENCPDVGGSINSGADCNDVKDCDKKYKTTIACPGGGPGTCKVKGKRSSCG